MYITVFGHQHNHRNSWSNGTAACCVSAHMLHSNTKQQLQPPDLVTGGVECVKCWQQQLVHCSWVAAEQHQQEELHMRAYVAVLVAA